MYLDTGTYTPTQGAKHQRQNETHRLNQPKNKIMKQFLPAFLLAFALLLGSRTTSKAQIHL